MAGFSRADLVDIRLQSQAIERSPQATPLEVARRMTAMQAQDLVGAKWSLGLRTTSGTLADVDAALDRGEIVRSWPFRGTLHFVVAEDLEWMLDLTAARTVAGAATRHRQLDLDEKTFEHAREVAVSALAGGRALVRDELFEHFRAAGIATDKNRGSHLLWYLSHTKTLCFGPMVGRSQAVVLVGEWVEHPRRPEREEGLGELATRYFASHGPATAKDFQWWTKLLGKDVTLAIQVAGDALEWVEVEGVPYGMAAGTLESHAGRRPRASVHLLPGFDEYLLGYTDRSAVLAPENFERIVPGSNGMFLSTIVVNGRISGTWSRKATSKAVSLAYDPFAPLPPLALTRAKAAAHRYAAYLGLPLA